MQVEYRVFTQKILKPQSRYIEADTIAAAKTKINKLAAIKAFRPDDGEPLYVEINIESSKERAKDQIKKWEIIWRAQI